MIEHHLVNFGYYDSYNLAVLWIDQWGFLVIIVAAFSPVPYKIFTIASGSLNMSLISFILGSIIGRGSRFFLEAALTKIYYENIDLLIKKIIQNIGYVMLITFSIILFILYLI